MKDSKEKHKEYNTVKNIGIISVICLRLLQKWNCLIDLE